MKLWMIILLIVLAYALFFLLPIKLSIYKQNGVISNEEIFKLAAEGNPDAVKLKKGTRRFLAIGIAGALLFVLEKHRFINF